MEVWDARLPALLARRKELEGILGILSAYTVDEVCRELGEISYLLGDLEAHR